MHSHQVEDLKRTSNKYNSNDYLIIVVVASAVESNLGVMSFDVRSKTTAWGTCVVCVF